MVQERFGIDKSGWLALVDAIFPNASAPESVILALAYAKTRKLDVFKRCVHIVPIYSREKGRMVDTVWPGIGELRTTAFRTGQYAGKSETMFGPDVTTSLGGVQITFPEWAQVTVYRLLNGQRVEFVGPRVRWMETYATAKRDSDAPNDMWKNRPYGQIEKCAEAAALRVAFPEEIGNDMIPEEVERGSVPPRTQSSDPVTCITSSSTADQLLSLLPEPTVDVTPEPVIETPVEEKPATTSKKLEPGSSAWFIDQIRKCDNEPDLLSLRQELTEAYKVNKALFPIEAELDAKLAEVRAKAKCGAK